MKNTVVRIFALSLAVAGFGAATVSSHAHTVNKATLAPAPQSLGGPIGLCIPGQGVCGMD